MKLPKGKYFVGDPCYCLDDEDNNKRWQNFCEESFKGEFVTEFEGIPMFAAGTAYGDGEFYDQEGNNYGVDAGMLSVVPLKLCTKKYKESLHVAHVVDFKEDFEASRDDDGTFHFGHITIETGSSGEYLDDGEIHFDDDDAGDIFGDDNIKDEDY